MADIVSPLMQQVFNVSKRERKQDLEHRCQVNDLGARHEVAKRGPFGHEPTLTSTLFRLKPSSSDSAYSRASSQLTLSMPLPEKETHF